MYISLVDIRLCDKNIFPVRKNFRNCSCYETKYIYEAAKVLNYACDFYNSGKKAIKLFNSEFNSNCSHTVYLYIQEINSESNCTCVS